MANPHTDRDEVLALAIRDLIVANKIDLELDDVLYGNHVLIQVEIVLLFPHQVSVDN